MRTKRNLNIALTATVVLTVGLAIAAFGTAAWAQSGPMESGLIGTWYGAAGGDISWLGVHTAGSTPMNGEMLLNWRYVKPALLKAGGTHLTVSRMTPGHGVWEQIARGQYRYTWYAYGIDDSVSAGQVHYIVRVSGLATITDSNNVSISYVYEVFDPPVAPQDMSGANRVFVTAGSAAETRVPLVTVTS